MEQIQELTVLVADDEPELLGAVCQLIDWQSIGFRLVGKAGNGLDALQLVEELQPDFLLTDIRMPFISGTALAKQAKAVQPLLQVAFLSGYDDFEYAKQGIEEEIVAYLLKPISMAELTEELRKIHGKIVKRLRDLTLRSDGAEERQLVAATMLLDDYLRDHAGQSMAKLRQLGVELAAEDTIMVAALRMPAAEHALLSMAERIFSRAYCCCGFCSGDRVIVLLGSKNGFGQIYPLLDELGQAVRRTWGTEAKIGLSKEFPSPAECHAAYLEAMEALQLAERGHGLYAAGGWDDMAMLCARAIKIIEKDYMDEELTLQSVSERLHISASYLGANIKRYAGDTFMNLRIKKRMDVALKLLTSGTSRIADVARRCGYSDQSYFGYCFKKYYGVSPARMRSQNERKEAEG